MSGKYWGKGATFLTDFKGALNFLVDFVASKENRIAVYR